MTQPLGFKKSNIFLFLAVSVLIRMTSSVGRKQSQILTTKVYFLLSHLSVDFWLELDNLYMTFSSNLLTVKLTSFRLLNYLSTPEMYPI